MKLGKAIKTIRKALGVTQVELSEKTGISQTSLSKIEGDTRPSDANLKKICKALQVPTAVVYMLSFEDSDVPANKKNKFKLLFPVIQNLAMEIVGTEGESLIKEKKVTRSK